MCLHYYNPYSWTERTKTFLDFSFIALGANYEIETRQRIHCDLADKCQQNLVGCPLDRDFSSN